MDRDKWRLILMAKGGGECGEGGVKIDKGTGNWSVWVGRCGG